MHADPELLRLAEIGRRFSGQWRGRRPGALHRYVRELVDVQGHRTFEALLIELEYRVLAARVTGRGGCPVIRVDRGFEIVRYIENGIEKEATFKRIRNIAQFRKNRFPAKA